MRSAIVFPSKLNVIEQETKALGFQMASEPETGAFLRCLAASKQGAGRFLELGTGTGFGTCWILDGMDLNSTLLTGDQDTQVVAVAQQFLGEDERLTIQVADARGVILSSPNYLRKVGLKIMPLIQPLIQTLTVHPALQSVSLNWATGLVMAVIR